ncbi:MAG: FIST N-terminal domain-containing protein [Methyloceanibacter sp.]|uniref:FIST N-terminal domain-containing protein n=1 Tax=Methyloceanibacter sp. TaxID=1965321 RepID=UPI003C5DD241
MYGAHANRRACGVQTAWTSANSPEAAIAEIAEVVDSSEIGQLLVFFPQTYEAEALSQALSEAFAGVPVAGCSTSGEITPAGFSDRSVLVVAFPRKGFRFVSRVIPEVQALSVERATDAVQALRAGLDRVVNGERYENLFAVSLIDGLSKCEEAIVSAIGWALGDIPLVGGSAGDGLTLSGTCLLHDGQVHRGAALLLLVETVHPVRSFYCDHFEPTDTKLVVTSSDTSTRTVYEFNAEPAAQEYASAVGLEPSSLAPMSFAAHPVVVRIGGDYYCRSIQRVNDDGSLSFFCAIDDGVVLTVAEPRDMVKSMEAELERLDAAIGGIDFVLGFECVLRRLDAENRQVKHQVSDLYRRYHVVGFHTYGEQYNAMHLNQTFTGVAIGRQGSG